MKALCTVRLQTKHKFIKLINFISQSFTEAMNYSGCNNAPFLSVSRIIRQKTEQFIQTKSLKQDVFDSSRINKD